MNWARLASLIVLIVGQSLSQEYYQVGQSTAATILAPEKQGLPRCLRQVCQQKDLAKRCFDGRRAQANITAS